MLSSIVLDCSVTVSWFMIDETSTISNDILNLISKEKAIVPSIWQLEVGNVLLMCQRNKRITKEQRLNALHILNELPIIIDDLTSKYAWQDTIELAEKYSLSLYDACYLELSLRYSLPLATFDNQLKKAANLASVKLI